MRSLVEFFQIHTAGVIVTDKWSELENVPPRIRDVFVIAVVDGSTDDEVWTADLVVCRHNLNGLIPRPLIKRLISFVTKARRTVELFYVSDDDYEIAEVLSQEERTLYELLMSHREGLSSRQIEMSLGWSPTKVRVYVYKLRHKLGQFGMEVVKEGRRYRIREEVLT